MAEMNKVTQAYCILLVYLHEATESKTYHHWQHESKSQELDLDGQSIEAARHSADLIPTHFLRILVSMVMSEDQKALVVRAKRLL
jgi:hypothetical protein